MIEHSQVPGFQGVHIYTYACKSPRLTRVEPGTCWNPGTAAVTPASGHPSSQASACTQHPGVPQSATWYLEVRRSSTRIPATTRVDYCDPYFANQAVISAPVA